MTMASEILTLGMPVPGMLTSQYDGGGKILRCANAASHGAFPQDKPGVSVLDKVNLTAVHLAQGALS